MATVQLMRVIAVIALVVAAAALATPKGRLPLALRGVMKVLGTGNGEQGTGNGEKRTGGAAPGWKRLLAFSLILLAMLLALI